MKKQLINIFSLFAILAFSSVSCDRAYLEPWPPDGAKQPEDIWNFYDYARGFLDNIYVDNARTGTVNDVSGRAALASACDEAKHSDQMSDVQRFTNGVWGPTNSVNFYCGMDYMKSASLRSPWLNAYTAIRTANIFLQNVDNSVLIDDLGNPARRHDRTNFKGQAYFMRAYFQFDLFKNYGEFPIATKSMALSDSLYRERDSMEACFRQIMSDCDNAIELLPLLWDDNEFYRANKTAAQALKSRVALYYASPLYQGDFEKFGLPANSTGDVTRWQNAAKYAREAINDNPYYNLMPVSNFNPPYGRNGSYNSMLCDRGADQVEIIYGTQYYSNADDFYNLPRGIEGCMGYTNPTQEMVDEFEVVTGFGTRNAKAEKFDWNNPEHAAHPYANRDPRFYASIIYNGARWGLSPSRRFVIDTYEGGKHRDRKDPYSTKTGYYYRKMLNESFYSNTPAGRAYDMRLRPDFRVAELLLNYAEAMNEAYGPEAVEPGGEPLRIGNATNALEAVNLIRDRVNMPPLATGMSRDEMRTAIKHERAVELCFEGHRFYDLRRWKEGDKLGKPIHGIRIEATGFDKNNRPDGFTYKVEKVEDRVWEDKMYWWPIPYNEIVKYGGKLKQNPEWK